jgi:hypothetical protein
MSHFSSYARNVLENLKKIINEIKKTKNTPFMQFMLKDIEYKIDSLFMENIEKQGGILQSQNNILKNNFVKQAKGEIMQRVPFHQVQHKFQNLLLANNILKVSGLSS